MTPATAPVPAPGPPVKQPLKCAPVGRILAHVSELVERPIEHRALVRQAFLGFVVPEPVAILF
jgi:hypothetical protein